MSISELIDDDINILIETLSNFKRMKHSNPYRKGFIEDTEKNIQWMLNFKKQYENKTIRPNVSGINSTTTETNEPMQGDGKETKEASQIQGL